MSVGNMYPCLLQSSRGPLHITFETYASGFLGGIPSDDCPFPWEYDK